LLREEKKMIWNIRQAAVKNQMSVLIALAKDIARSRKNQMKYTKMVTHMKALSQQKSSIANAQTLLSAMRSTTHTMQSLNATMNAADMRHTTERYARQSELMNMNAENMDEAMDNVMDDDDTDTESDTIVNQILDELGLKLQDGLVNVPRRSTTVIDDEEWKQRLQELGLNDRANP